MEDQDLHSTFDMSIFVTYTCTNTWWHVQWVVVSWLSHSLKGHYCCCTILGRVLFFTHVPHIYVCFSSSLWSTCCYHVTCLLPWLDDNVSVRVSFKRYARFLLTLWFVCKTLVLLTNRQWWWHWCRYLVLSRFALHISMSIALVYWWNQWVVLHSCYIPCFVTIGNTSTFDDLADFQWLLGPPLNIRLL